MATKYKPMPKPSPGKPPTKKKPPKVGAPGKVEGSSGKPSIGAFRIDLGGKAMLPRRPGGPTTPGPRKPTGSKPTGKPKRTKGPGPMPGKPRNT